jgi:two-component system, response regulator / RNA-binding antiterminator
MFELAVTAPGGHQVPPVFLKQLKRVTDFHTITISAVAQPMLSRRMTARSNQSTARFLRSTATPMALQPNPHPSMDTASNTSAAPLRVLLVDDGAHRVSLIHDELARQGHLVVGVLDSALLIHDCVLRLQPDVVVVDSESPSRDTLEHLGTVSALCPRPMVVFSEDAAQEPMQRALKAGVSAYVIAGLQPQRLLPVLQVAIARFEQDQALRGQLDVAQTQLSDRKSIERAKGLLMDELGLSEEQAYSHLRKLAMDRSQRLGQVAERVVQARDLLKPPG